MFKMVNMTFMMPVERNLIRKFGRIRMVSNAL